MTFSPPRAPGRVTGWVRGRCPVRTGLSDKVTVSWDLAGAGTRSPSGRSFTGTGDSSAEARRHI